MAACHGHAPLLAALAAAGADVCGSRSTRRGDTALHLAAAGGHSSCVDWLLARGAVAGAVNAEGRTAAHVAAARGRAAVLALLGQRGCDLRQCDFDGVSPLAAMPDAALWPGLAAAGLGSESDFAECRALLLRLG